MTDEIEPKVKAKDAGHSYRLYGRQQAKPLKPRQRRLIGDLLPDISITPTAAGVEALMATAGGRDIWLEVGFGGGEHLAWQAARHPDILMVGAEPFLNGVGKLLGQIDDQNLQNIRVLHGDVRPLLDALPTRCLSRLFVLHPDPWPKKKHHKRRIVSPDFLAHASRLLRPGCEFRVASDIPDYIRWTLMQVAKHNRASCDFLWTARRMADWTNRRDDWPQTRYEAKALREGRIATYLCFNRIA